MRQKIKSIMLIGLVVFLNSVYGCSGLQKEHVGKNYFDLDITPLVPGQNHTCKGEPLLVKEFSINPAFDSHSFVYRVTNSKYINDYYNEFVSYPAKLITEKIAENLCASRQFKPGLTNIKQDLTYRLYGKIIRLYGDLQEPNDLKAIVEIRMILEKKIDHTFTVISNKTYRHEEPMTSRKPDQLVSGWNKGLTKIITQFIKDFQLPAG